MTDGGTSGAVQIGLFFIFLWLAVITILLVLGYLGKINVAPTGPTGPSNGIIGPTGPTGPTRPVAATGPAAATTLSGPNGPISLTQNPNINYMGSIGRSAVSTCQFNNNGIIDDTQVINQNPQIIKWVLSNNNITSNYDNGVFTLPVGTYRLSDSNINTSVTYKPQNIGGTYRTMAVWLREENGNQVNESDLIGITSALSINGSSTILTFPSNLQFTVTPLKNKFSIITWHDSNYNLTIGCEGDKLTQLNIIQVS